MTVINKPNWRLAIGLIVFIYFICSIIVLLPKFNANQLALTGVAIDLTITAPFLYFLFIRKTNVANITVWRVFIVGVFLAGLLLQGKHVAYLTAIKKWVVPVIELGTISLVLYKFYTVKKGLKNVQIKEADFLAHCRIILIKILGNEKLSNVLASEFAVLYYLLKWKTITANKNDIIFSYHKTSNARLLVGTFIALIFAETLGFHFLLTIWSNTAAWVFTTLSFYTCLQFSAHIKAMKCRPILVFEDVVCLHNGLAGDVNVALENISQINFDNKNITEKHAVKLCLLKGLEKHNITIYLKQPVDVVRMFGIKKEASVILLHVDNPQEFVFTIENKLEELFKKRN